MQEGERTKVKYLVSDKIKYLVSDKSEGTRYVHDEVMCYEVSYKFVKLLTRVRIKSRNRRRRKGKKEKELRSKT